MKTVLNILLLLLFLSFVSGCDNKEKSNIDNSNNLQLTFHCKNGIVPDFTLNSNSNPSLSQIDNLCKCVSSKLIGWEKETAIKLANNKQSEVSSLHMAAFPSRFGEKMESCGANKL